WNFGDQPFSIALWIKLEQMPVGEQMIVGHDEGGGEQNKWAFEFWQGNLCFHVNSSRSESFRIGAIPWRGEVDRWHHLAVTREGSDFRIYKDGICVSEARHLLPVPSAKAPLTMGQAERLFVEGALDEVMLFDRELSADEVQGLAER
ncbi:MAG: LamG domain-containing protein, partial [Spartobacteria bacterium]|nr:LamG domain-containing protein [Spartobacteria bacterium]